MNEVIDLNEMPAMFGMCSQTECPHATTCLRQMVYSHANAKSMFLNVLNPRWLDAQKGKYKCYLKSQKERRAFGFIRTINAIPSGQVSGFRSSLMSRKGRKRYYQTRKGEIMLTHAEEQLIVKLANKYGVTLDEYFDQHKYVLVWG